MLKDLKPLKGFKDIIGQDSLLRAFISDNIEKNYLDYGYQKIELPTLDYQALFSSEFVGIHPWPGWHPRSLFSIVVKDFQENYDEENVPEHSMFLIPEGTASVCRFVAQGIETKKISSKIPQKYYYITRCFRNELVGELKRTKKREFTQIGLEYIGDGTVFSDLEVFNITVKNLVSLGFSNKDIRIRYSDVRLFNYLVEKGSLTISQQNKLKVALDSIASKRAKGLSVRNLQKGYADILNEIEDLSEEDKNLWEIMSSEYINIEEIDKKLEKFPLEIVKSLKGIFNESPKKLQELLTLDLAVIRGQDYYNKTTYQIDLITEVGIISELGGGGRYDHFIEKLITNSNGKKYTVPATGMAYSLERLSYALEKYLPQGKITAIKNSKKGIVLWSDNRRKALIKSESFRRMYDIVEVIFSSDPEVAMEYAENKKFKFKKI